MAEYSRILGDTVKSVKVIIKADSEKGSRADKRRRTHNYEYRKRDFDPDSGCPLLLFKKNPCFRLAKAGVL